MSIWTSWDEEFFIAKTHNNTQYKQCQITSGTGVWVLVSLQMQTANNSCSHWIWSLQQFEAFINTHLFIWTFICGGYTSTCLAANSSGLFRLYTNNCSLHSSIGHIKRLAYSLRFAALINKKLSVWNIVKGGVLLIILLGEGNNGGIPPVKICAKRIFNQDFLKS
jgi:hypothetical protein